MKIYKRIIIVGLSIFMLVVPCFARTIIISLNDHEEVQIKTKECDDQEYVSLTTLSEALDYNVNYDNHNKIVMIEKYNKNLTLGLAKNEAKEIDNHIYIPMEQVTSYFGDSIKVIRNVSYRGSYLAWLDSIEKELDDKLGDLYSDTSTLNLIKLEATKCEAWDNALNKIYSILEEELPDYRMETLRKAQRNWIVYRDSSAQFEQDYYETGSAGRIVYAATLCSLTKERCYYLVKTYMP